MSADVELDRQILDREQRAVSHDDGNGRGRLPASAVTAGSVALQMSVVRSQRGWKRQPGGNSAIEGTTPEISCSLRRPNAAREPSRGSDATSPRV